MVNKLHGNIWDDAAGRIADAPGNRGVLTPQDGDCAHQHHAGPNAGPKALSKHGRLPFWGWTYSLKTDAISPSLGLKFFSTTNQADGQGYASDGNDWLSG